MPARALIIAIEDYPNVEVGGIAKKLPETLQTGLAFKAWLEAKWKAESNSQIIFCSEPAQRDGKGATSQDITEALLQLEQEGQSATEELFFFFSGHGFSFVEKIAGPANRADIVIASDFRKPALSGGACLNLDEIIEWLRAHLGPGRHYYFIDACRTKLSAKDVQRPGGAPPWNPQASGEASSYLLQSTRDGDIAAGTLFPSTLFDGLRGNGRAKVWDPQIQDAMMVRYDSLRSYMKAVLPQIDGGTRGPDSESDAILATIRPIPKSRVTVTLDNGSLEDKGELLIRHWRARMPERQPWTGPSMSLEMEPDDYSINLQIKSADTRCDDDMPVDLYDDRALVFHRVPVLESMGPSGPGPMPSGPGPIEIPTVDVNVVVPARAKFSLRSVDTGLEHVFERSEYVQLPRGRYFATLRGMDEKVFKRQQIDLTPGAAVTLNIADWRQSAPHVAITSRLPDYAVQGDAVDFSELLGAPVIDPDLDLWLALVGGGRILGSTGDYSKLSGFPLHNFSDEEPYDSPIYILAGFENIDTECEVGLSNSASVPWTLASQPPDMPGIRETYFKAKPGSQLVSFRIDGHAPYTIASFASPNRAMLITLTLDDKGNPRVSQYLLLLGHLLDHLPLEVRERVRWRNHLRDVRFLAQASRAFRKRRDLMKEVSQEELTELFDAKWLDPIASSLAGYEALRRGTKHEMGEVIANMKLFFGDIPDTWALAKLAGENVGRPKDPPLFLDGLRAFPDHDKWLPLPSTHLDFTSTWTAWRSAVEI